MGIDMATAVALTNSAVMIGAIIFGAGKLGQKVKGVEHNMEIGFTAVSKDVQALGAKLDDTVKEVYHMKGVLDERDRRQREGS